VIAVLLLLACAGCGSDGRVGAAAQVARVTVRDFHISAPRHLRPGNVVLTVGNRGPDSHELIVVRVNGSRLPFRPDGMTVDEEALERQTVGALEPGEPGSLRRLRVHLAPGRYELFCNMSGHYLGGMHATMRVG
jgi:uncharacterized cupredoxin-like copper-binding protein